jgi:nucleotide-binding universal stress UspA family protein
MDASQILILKEDFMFNVDKIIVPTDFSEYSDFAFEKALDLAEACNAKVYLTHVVADAPDIFALDRFNKEGQKKILKDLEKNSKESFEKQKAKFPQSQKVDIETKVLRGVPSKEILGLQKKINADLLVVATHGQTAFEEFLWGNTASKLIRYSKCSVLVVRKPKYS